MHGLTDRQKEILSFLKSFIKKNGFPPTLREVSEDFGFVSTNTVRGHLRLLQKKGFIKRAPFAFRGIKIL